MSLHSPTVVEAFISKDHSKLSELETARKANDLEKHCIRSLRLFVTMITHSEGYKWFEETKNHVTESLNRPSPDLDLFTLLNGITTLIAFQTHPQNDVEILLNRLKALKVEKLHADVKAFIHFIECRFELHHRNYQKQLEILEEGLILTKPGKSSWLLLITQRAESALVAIDIPTMRASLDQLKTCRDIPFKGIWPYEILESQYQLLTGNLQEALHVLDSMPSQTRDQVQGLLFRNKIDLLLRQGRFAETDQLFEDAKNLVAPASPGSLFFRRHFTSLDYESLKAMKALRKKDLQTAYFHTLRFTSESKAILPPWRRGWEGYFYFFNIEMAAGRGRAARILIQLLDPTETLLPVEWGRLHLLEKNFGKAVEAFKRATINYGGAHLKEHLAFASEILPETLAEIFMRIFPPSPPLPSPKTKTTPETQVPSPSVEDFFVGASLAIKDIRSKIKKFAPLHSTLLISGETGTGKEVVARLLHNLGPHSKEPFIAINCGGLSDNLIESELFGYEKGAFTGANLPHEGLLVSAGKGTVFLDEISSMSHHLQASLLRVLEDEHVRPVGSNKSFKMQARIIAATNEPLTEMIEQKKFRKDLFYRLGRLHIDIPPLRERREDIPLLTHHFLKKFFGALHYEITQELLDALTRQDWPGNVRELRNLIERMVYQSGNSELLTADLLETDNKPLRPTYHSPAQPFPPKSTSAPPSNENGLSYQNHRHQKILEMLNTGHRITRSEVMRELRCSPNTATHDLKTLEEKGLVRRIQPTTNAKSTYFVLS